MKYMRVTESSLISGMEALIFKFHFICLDDYLKTRYYLSPLAVKGLSENNWKDFQTQ